VSSLGVSSVDKYLDLAEFESQPRFTHILNSDKDSELSLRCAKFGDILRVSSASTASGDDAINTGLHPDAFVEPPPVRITGTELALTLSAAMQGILTVWLLLFYSVLAVEQKLLTWAPCLKIRPWCAKVVIVMCSVAIFAYARER